MVDGAWLGHVHKVATPFLLRGVTIDAWQILSEELGDGDIEKNHVFLYTKLLEDVGINLPNSHDIDFSHPRHKMGGDLAWRAGESQLLISLFPDSLKPRSFSEQEQRLVRMLRLKADASHQIHCSSRVKIGNRSLSQWLAPGTWIDSDGYIGVFLRALSNARPRVVRGNSGKSLLMKKLMWNGRIFGACISKEVDDMQSWIDGFKD